jgi:site-specific recombinase XerD
MNLSDLKRQFLEYMEIEKGRALRTIENYDHYLTVFIEQTKITDPKDITNEKVRDFSSGKSQSMKQYVLLEIQEKRKLKLYLIALRNFFKISYKRGITPSGRSNRIGKKLEKRVIDVLSKEEVKDY